MKTFDIDKKLYSFSISKFNNYFITYRKQAKMKVEELETKIAKDPCVEQSTVHTWRFGNSGPSDLELVKKLAKELEIKDYLYLLEEEKAMTDLNDLELQSVKRVYDAFVSFLDDFQNTDGFTGVLWLEFKDKGSRDPENDVYDYAEKKMREVHHVMNQEYFYLRDKPIYNEFQNYFDGELRDI